MLPAAARVRPGGAACRGSAFRVLRTRPYAQGPSRRPAPLQSCGSMGQRRGSGRRTAQPCGKRQTKKQKTRKGLLLRAAHESLLGTFIWGYGPVCLQPAGIMGGGPISEPGFSACTAGFGRHRSGCRRNQAGSFPGCPPLRYRPFSCKYSRVVRMRVCSGAR